MEALEEYHRLSQTVPEVKCTTCDVLTKSQAYVIVLRRAHITRRWYFCSLEHLRTWAKPV